MKRIRVFFVKEGNTLDVWFEKPSPHQYSLATFRRRLRRRVIAVLLALATVPLLAQERPRILIITDLEGVGGINDRDEQILPGQRRFEESRRLLIGEVNAAVEGALQGGAREVVVWDGHDGSRTLSIDEIHPRAQLIQGRPTPADYYLSERPYDGIMFVGQHAMAGAAGPLAHSQSSATIERITLNGRAVGEIGQVAAIGGYYSVPTIMLAGDEAACRELLDLQPKAETVAVKRLVGKASTLSLSHARPKCALRLRRVEPWNACASFRRGSWRARSS